MGARGEESIKLTDGLEVSLLFTNRALAQVENQLGESVTQTASKVASGDVSMNTLVVLVQNGMIAAKRDMGDTSRVTKNDAYDLIDDVGFLKALEKVTLAMTGCLTYGQQE